MQTNSYSKMGKASITHKSVTFLGIKFPTFIIVKLFFDLSCFAGDSDFSCLGCCLYSSGSDLSICFSGCMFSVFSQYFPQLQLYIFCEYNLIFYYIHDQVIEIVDRYDTDCIPLSSRDNKVRYIQGLEDKRCNRTITVDIYIIFSSFYILLQFFLI